MYSHNVREELNPIHLLPDEIGLKVFSHLNLAALGVACRVSKEWKRLASDSTLWKDAIYKEIAFGNDKWAGCFGKDVVKDEDSKEEFSSLPWKDFIEDCQKFKSLFPEKKAKDTLMLVRLPKTLNGGLTLMCLSDLAKKYFARGFRYISKSTVNELGYRSIEKSSWVLMTKDILPGSRNKNCYEQQQVVAGLAEKALLNYKVPETLEAAACILSQYFTLKIRLFSEDPLTYTICEEKVEGYQKMVGGFNPSGLEVGGTANCYDFVGVAALRKF